MAMREPKAGEEMIRDITGLLDVPVRTERLTDEQREAELEALRELAETGEWSDAATVTAEIRERARRER